MKPFVILFLFFTVLFISIPWLQADPGNPELESCFKLMNKGRFEDARKEVQQYRRKHPDDPRAVLLLAQLEGDFYKALALFKEAEILAVESNTSAPDSATAAEAVFARAELIYVGGNLSAAEEIYEHLITTYPTSDYIPDAFYHLGVIRLVLGAPNEAIERFNMYLEKNPNDPKRALASIGIMECHLALENWSEVLTSAREVLEEEDEGGAVTPRVLETIALAWRKMGNEDNASWYTERLLNNYPDSFQAHTIREKGKRIANELSLSSNSRSTSTDSGKTEHAESYAPLDDNSSLSEPVGSEGLDGKRIPVFSVQASAFKERMNALNMYNTLKAAGFDVRVEMRTVLDTHWYKILIGRYKTREEADKIINSVTEVTGLKANVIIE